MTSKEASVAPIFGEAKVKIKYKDGKNIGASENEANVKKAEKIVARWDKV